MPVSLARCWTVDARYVARAPGWLRPTAYANSAPASPRNFLKREQAMSENTVELRVTSQERDLIGRALGEHRIKRSIEGPSTPGYDVLLDKLLPVHPDLHVTPQERDLIVRALEEHRSNMREKGILSGEYDLLLGRIAPDPNDMTSSLPDFVG